MRRLVFEELSLEGGGESAELLGSSIEQEEQEGSQVGFVVVSSFDFFLLSNPKYLEMRFQSGRKRTRRMGRREE
jgi:hypothetical protein